MPEYRIISEDRARVFKIQPEDIDASCHFFGAFDHTETEISAMWIIRFMQKRGAGWVPFTKEEIQAFYAEKHPDNFSFNRLIEPEHVSQNLAKAFAGEIQSRIPKGGGWIVVGDDGKYRVTDNFVMRCYSSSPAKE